MKKNIVGGIVTKPKLLFICLLVLTLLPISAYAVTVDLGTAANFGALGGSKVTNTGFTIINGDVGVWPGTSITGFPPGIATGTIHTGDSVAGTAQADLLTAYNIAAGAPGGSPGPGELGGATLLPGVYTYGSSAPWTFGAGDLTLDANGDSSAQWIFQIGTTLITPADAKVVLIRGASANNVFWQVGTSATLGATNTFAGNILADQSITLGGGALNGRALAMNAKVEISVAETITPTAADSNLHIRIWYGPNQVFAQQGTPQRWINILGDIINPARVQSLTYSLNGGPQLPLSMGPPNPRLAGEGDLNVELACVDVNLLHAPTQNNIVITATDLNDHATTASVNCEYFNMNSWRLPYDINWSTVMDSNLADSNIFNAVQIVDGQWTVEPNGLSTVVEGYNRSFAIGDMNNWRDYEVNVPITVHQSYHDGNQPAVGLVMRWTGYYPDANDNNQPVSGNHPIGAAALFKWSDDSNGKYTIYNHDFNVVGEANSPGGTLLPEATYILKMRVETIPDTGGLYSFKVWESNQPEPNTWLLQRQEDLNDPQNGSVLLLAHHVDATFGNITVINTAPLFTIGGRVQDTNGALIGGVTINGLPGNPVTDINGLYTAIVSDGWTWSVAPAKTGYIFDPPSRSYTDVNVNYNSENYYTGTLTFTISGNAGVNGVTMSGLPGNPVTDINGLYTAAVPHGWSGTATPTKTGYTFTPTNRSYADVNADSNSQNYTASQITFTISGNADENGVTMSGLPGNPVTDINGLYTATVPYGWSGTVTPAKTGYTFTPTSRSYADVNADSNNQNYTASQNTMTIKQFTITAGTTTTVSKDGFVINGTFDANLQDIAGSTAIYIRLSNASELVFEGVIPYNSDRLKNGRYSYTRRDNAPDTIRIVLFDLNKKTFHILAKRASLTGLSCPVNVELEWGRYIGHAQADETIVNGKKPIPMVLLSGYADALRVDKASVNTNTKKANRDSLTVQGAIAFKSTAENLKQHSLTLHWGDQDFNVPAGEFVASTHGRYTYKSPRGTVIEIKNASFDLEKCTFTFSVKNATIASRTGTVVCRITCDTFDQSVAYPLR